MNVILMTVLGLAVTVGIFLAIRNVINWYHRVNERITLMKENNRLLSNILTELQSIKD